MHRLVRLVLIAALCSLAFPAATSASPLLFSGWQGVYRWAGADRYATAVEVSENAFDEGAATVVVATGANWPDALCAAPLCNMEEAPLLLVKPTSVPASVLKEIERLGATNAIILGGTAAVSSDVETALKNALGSANVRRIAGGNRYDTAARIAAEVKADATWNHSAFYVTGDNFPDALGASAIAASQGMPILLTKTESIPGYTAAAGVGVTDAYIVGGTAVVGAAVERTLESDLGDSHVLRIAGSDRYETTAALIRFAPQAWKLDYSRLGLSNGLNFPDALAAGVALGKFGQVQLLAPPTSLSPAAARVMRSLIGLTESVVVFGGTSAVSEDVARQAAAIFDPDYTGLQTLKTISATPLDATPNLYDDGIIWVKAYDQLGNPIEGAYVTSTWHFDTSTETLSTTTDGGGHANLNVYLDGATVGYTIRVDITVTHEGVSKSTSTSLTPEDGPPTPRM